MPTMSDKARRLWIGGIAALGVAAAVLALWWYLSAAAAPGPLERQRSSQLGALDSSSAVAEAEISLATIRADLVAERGAEGLPRRLRHVSAKLETALLVEGSEADTERWSEIEAALGRLGEQVIRSDPAATDTIDTLLDTLRATQP